ncbi:hypothetical protein P5P86_11760 [Nocardioides sp. BP30]|uniref:hypothetical protein n=1 Tax=Nocardioides sp. BP30 TaxID=3036374 RepID=UPI0024695579|nr:hypothetical protein [Nocardioides sp. BP30]WGL50640.1 hypothetical protein P5P86_11760 [Nocardioides sp. BP30]
MAYAVVRVEGLSATVRALEGMGIEVMDLRNAMAKIATQSAQIIQAHAPVGETGRLRADVRGNRAKAKAVVSAGRTSVPYAGPINYGWKAHHIRAAMFMQSADARMQFLAPLILEAEINRLLVARGLA